MKNSKKDNHLIDRLIHIFDPVSNDPISLTSTDKVYIINCLEKAQSRLEEKTKLSDIPLSALIRERIEVLSDQKEYKEREERLFEGWKKEEQERMKKNNLYNYENLS